MDTQQLFNIKSTADIPYEWKEDIKGFVTYEQFGNFIKFVQTLAALCKQNHVAIHFIVNNDAWMIEAMIGNECPTSFFYVFDTTIYSKALYCVLLNNEHFSTYFCDIFKETYGMTLSGPGLTQNKFTMYLPLQ